jgi:hypothetical protein
VTKIDDIAQVLIDYTTAAITGSGGDLPDRICVVPGELAWDDCECGLLAVRWTGNSYGTTVTSNAPDTDQGCGQPVVNMGFNVVLLRCITGPQVGGAAPTCAQLASSAFVLHRDVFALEEAMAGAVIALRNARTILDWALAGQAPVGPQGNCVGTSYTLTVAIRNTWRPCG